MKKSMIGIFAVLFCLSFCFVLINCDDSSDGGSGTECENTEPCLGVTVKACCNNDGACWYDKDGDIFNCDGAGETLDCGDAALAVIAEYCTS